MANNFVHNVDKWLLLSESETDFAVLFVRTWIPFNAWYCNSYPHHNNYDRPCIDEIKTTPNPFKDKIRALLDGDFTDARTFKIHLGHLHSLLTQFPIPDADEKKRVTFERIWFRENNNPPQNAKHKRVIYTAERLSDKSVKSNAIVARTGHRLHTYIHTRYDLTHFLNDLASNTLLNEEQKGFAKAYFTEIDPKKPESVIAKRKGQSIKANGVHFIDDSDLLSQAIIEILYNLRCKLFHGELQPTKNNLTVYEPCYHMLRILLKSLI